MQLPPKLDIIAENTFLLLDANSFIVGVSSSRWAVIVFVAKLAVINTLIPGLAEIATLAARAGERCNRTFMISLFTIRFESRLPKYIVLGQ